MRYALLAACLTASLAYSQGTSGTYKGTAWQINANHALVWGGAPYMPVGAQIDGSVPEVEKALTSGVKDLVVDLPANGAAWSDVFEALNKENARFLLRVNSLAPMARGFAVEPQGYRVPNLTAARKITFPLPEATNALVLMVDQGDATIVKSQRVPIKDGVFTFDAPEINGLPHVLLVYPETKSLEQPDFWDGMDSHRDALLSALKRFDPGAGLRGIVNPLGKMMRIPGRNSRFVPTSSYFRDELKGLLESRYRSIETATKAWTVGAPDFTDFDTLARMVPLWSGYRGVPSLWDPANDRIYSADIKRSAAWKDISDAVLIAATRRFKSLVSAIRQAADVPVIQEWAGWAPPYDGSQISIDGVGVQTSAASPNALIESAAKPVSSVLRWNRPGWLVATDVSVGEGGLTADQAAGQLGDLGVRGCFVKGTEKASGLKPMDPSLADQSPSVLYFPENATNPPFAQRLPGGRWWLPSPSNGDRIDMGSKFAAYRLEDGPLSFTVLWSTAGPQRVALRFIDPKVVTFETLDGSDPAPKINKNGVEVNVTDTPLIIRGTNEIPAPDPVVEETMDTFTSILRALGSERGAVSEDQYYFTEAARGFDRNPGASMMALKRVLAKALLKVAPYVWIEAEGSKQHNFSQISNDPGCSGRAALELDTNIAPEGSFSAVYDVQVRNTGDQEVWMSARLPAAYRDDVSVQIAGQAFSVPSTGVSPYGDGYVWYRLGTTKLAGSTSQLKVTVNAPSGADLGIDTFLVTPPLYHPNGAFMPHIPLPPAEKPKKGKKG